MRLRVFNLKYLCKWSKNILNFYVIYRSIIPYSLLCFFAEFNTDRKRSLFTYQLNYKYICLFYISGILDLCVLYREMLQLVLKYWFLYFLF